MKAVVRLALIAVLLVLAACRQSVQPTPTPPATSEGDELDIEMAVDPSPPAAGDAVLVLTLREGGVPVDAARVEVRGDMNHAGMVPVFGTAAEGDNGVYRIPFEWTMGGDWIVTVDITLPDGRQVTRQFEMTVVS